jgi:cobalt-zinc-cadmium efflux system membrane fusion protein
MITRPSLRFRHAVRGAALLFALAACNEAPEPTPVDPGTSPDTALLSAAAVALSGFTLDTARLAPWVASATAPARVIIDPTRLQTLGAIVEGRISSVSVRVGDQVRAGQILVAIHSHEIMDARSGLVEAEAHLRTAEAEREAAGVGLRRAERLLAAKAIGQAVLDRAQVTETAAAANLSAAEADLERARGLMEHLLGDGELPANLDPHDVLVRAPISGAVVERSAMPGAVVLPGEPLLSVADPTALQLELRLADGQLAGVVPGATLQFSLVGEGESGALGTAVVSRVSPVAEESSRTTLVIATIRNAPPGLRAARFATAFLSGAATDSVLRLPVRAVQSLAGDTVVFVAEQRGEGLHIRAVPVRIGRRDNRYAEVLVGLEVGNVVIADGATVARAELLKRREGAGGE